MTLREAVNELPRSYHLAMKEKTPAFSASYTETYVALKDVLALLESDPGVSVDARRAELAALRKAAAATQRFALGRAWMHEWNELSLETRRYVAGLDEWFESLAK